jgi:hypothetical protein
VYIISHAEEESDVLIILNYTGTGTKGLTSQFDLRTHFRKGNTDIFNPKAAPVLTLHAYSRHLAKDFSIVWRTPYTMTTR